jgi:hypothetical protein
MNPPLLRHAALGVLILLSSCAGAIADPTAYFPGLTADEKLEYTEWVGPKSSTYPRHAYMPRDGDGDDDDGAAVFWNVDGGRIDLAVAVRAGGWVGLGISEAGGMIGSDVVLFRASDPSVAVDAHVVGDRSAPIVDDCQDWALVGAPATGGGEGGWMIVEVSRSIDTGDSQDRAISYDANLWAAPTRIVAAWGDEDSVSYHGDKRARGSVRIFANYTGEVTEARALLDTLEAGSDGYFDVAHADYEVPANETTYEYLCRTFDELNLNSSVTMVGGTTCSRVCFHFTYSLLLILMRLILLYPHRIEIMSLCV